MKKFYLIISGAVRASKERFVPFNPLFAACPLGHCATSKGSSYTKNEYNLFYQKLDAEYFLFNIFLKKLLNKKIFSILFLIQKLYSFLV